MASIEKLKSKRDTTIDASITPMDKEESMDSQRLPKNRGIVYLRQRSRELNKELSNQDKKQYGTVVPKSSTM